MEAWKYEELKRRLWNLLRMIWKKGKILRDWRKSIIVLYKRGEKETTGQETTGGGISLLC